jgi:hypothetical protein
MQHINRSTSVESPVTKYFHETWVASPLKAARTNPMIQTTQREPQTTGSSKLFWLPTACVLDSSCKVGDCSVGKTSILLRYTEGTFSDAFHTGVDLKTADLTVRGEKIKLEVRHTSPWLTPSSGIVGVKSDFERSLLPFIKVYRWPC